MIGLCQPTIMDLLILCRNARPDEIQQYEALVGMEWDPETVAVDHFNRPGVKYVLLDDDTAICAGGFDQIIPGVWHAWMVGTMDNWGTHWRSITKWTRRVMEAMLEQDARRIQLCVLNSRQKACEWYVRGLKMRLEGHMQEYGSNGETMDMYARVKESSHG